MSDDKLADKVARANKARALLDDPTFAEAFSTMEASYIDAWRSTPARDTDARERLWLAVQVLGKVKEHFGHVIADGQMAQSDIDALVQKSQPLHAV